MLNTGKSYPRSHLLPKPCHTNPIRSEMICGHSTRKTVVSHVWALLRYLAQEKGDGDGCFCLRPKNSQQPDTTKIPRLPFSFSRNCGVGVCTKTCTCILFHSFTTFLWDSLFPGIGQRWAHRLNGFWSACLRKHMFLCCSWGQWRYWGSLFNY